MSLSELVKTLSQLVGVQGQLSEQTDQLVMQLQAQLRTFATRHFRQSAICRRLKTLS